MSGCLAGCLRYATAKPALPYGYRGLKIFASLHSVSNILADENTIRRNALRNEKTRQNLLGSSIK